MQASFLILTLNSNMVTQTFSLVYSAPANMYSDPGYITITKQGYTPIGIIGISNPVSQCHIYKVN